MNLKTGLFSSFKDPERIYYEDQDARELLSSCILALLPKIAGREIVILCIGTDRSTGDSLGPIVGSKLAEKRLERFHIYGTLKDPVHAVNLEESIALIEASYRNPFIIAIDACLGKLKSVGSFQIGPGPVKPGAGVNKDLPAVGDMHLTGIVNVSGFMEFFVLQNTRLHLVMTMAGLIADSIADAEKRHVVRSSWMKRSPIANLTKKNNAESSQAE
ncbi:spore protease YyaC [Bacillus sp. FJAT-42376]|uniref:spore protease YyaC n=1 Tax=Bacillus sp. FJAT-42376 TaxID=2014076 RepID=UPI000F4E914F|nr:spore protease YyaC [Bacillus sp. FJAT-42376]AZB41128.1 spore protease YyaC [Bacillus sp. FJAT-42376]